ncbi:MAG: pyrroline-5-carboxylate reductase [Candidatus Woesearchaeota archaeon]|nr:pyrroline-5-carboxylate reductase [Candidatus Woesearchaeota archaeon]
MKLGFIGTGEMGAALIHALSDYKIFASDASTEKLASLPVTPATNQEVVDKSDIVFLCVRPQNMDEVLDEIKVGEQIIVSIAAAVSLDHLEKKLGKKKLARLMPNIPAAVKKMAGGLAARNLADEDIEKLLHIVRATGTVTYVEEEQINNIMTVSGSGPAFVAKILDEYAKAAVENGMSEDLAKELTFETFKGTIEYLERKNITPAELVEHVSSPGGITVEAIKELTTSFDKVFKRALERTKELEQ